MAVPNVSVEMGALVAPLSEQLAETGIPDGTVQVLQGHADAITRLYLHGFMSTAARDRARGRLMRMITKEAHAAAKKARA